MPLNFLLHPHQQPHCEINVNPRTNNFRSEKEKKSSPEIAKGVLIEKLSSAHSVEMHNCGEFTRAGDITVDGLEQAILKKAVKS